MSSCLDFICIDVETANCDRESICQIGLVTVKDSSIVDTWEILVNPEDWFDPWNIDIHGISEEMVQNAPTFPEIFNDLCQRIGDLVVVSHTPFDRTAIHRAIKKYDLGAPLITWLDSARIVRRAWPDRYGRSGYGLKPVAQDLGIDFEHHDALEDARAASEIVLKACAKTGLSINEWLNRVEKPIYRKSSAPSVPDHEVNVEGPLFGETVVFTGTLSIVRKDAQILAAKSGCLVRSSVTNQTTMLVLGIQDRDKLAGYNKSSKHRKAESLISKGQPIQILTEKDFLNIAKEEGVSVHAPYDNGDEP